MHQGEGHHRRRPSPLWPRCAAIQPGNLRFAAGEALSREARSDLFRLSGKVRNGVAITTRLRLSLACIRDRAHGVCPYAKSSGTCLPSFEFRPLTCFVPALPRQSIKGSCPSRGQGECATIELRTLFSFSPVVALAKMPGMGHKREDLTAFQVRFWPVGAYLIIYRAERQPIEIVAVTQGARDIPAFLHRRLH